MERPDLIFSDTGSPRSAVFDDIYFSDQDGLAETSHVFLQPSQLQQRFADMPDHGHFTIAETGFGTGLNLLLSWQLFERLAPDTARMTFISIERYPLSKAQIRQTLSLWPELSGRVERLIEQYPPRVPGFHLVELSDRVDLLLLFGDVNDCLTDLNARVDAWFLDGFTPARNPGMWHPQLFQSMARLSHPGTTVATFTAASQVGASLQGAGFRITRLPGFGSKRAILKAVFEGITGPPSPGLWPRNEWYWPLQRPTVRTAIVVGAGLAGAYTAWELARRGWTVTVVEQANRVAAGASGNVQGAIYARLSHDDTPVNRFYTQALHLAQTRLAQLPEEVAHQQCGLLQLNQGAKEARRFEHMAKHNPFAGELADCISQAQASQRAGVEVPSDALYFPGGGWLKPPELIDYLLHQDGIDVRTRHKVTGLSLQQDQWQVKVETPAGPSTLIAGQVILCNAWQARELEQSSYLPLKPIGGQVTRIETTEKLSHLKTVICSDRYLVPAYQGAHSLGASFHVGQTEPHWRAEDDAGNLTNAHQRLPDLINGEEVIRDARAGQRCASPDYCPQVGPLLDAEHFARTYRTGLQKRLTARLPEPPFQKGLWVNLAHGSKGLCSIPMASSALAAWIAGEPMPLAQSVINHLNPNRFAIRQMIRGKR
jgi:tRNA 5-methylaminomethyl-2-thiouridine biosynthesis bifunctional protein